MPHLSSSAPESTAPGALLIGAVRGWREARDSGRCVQPSLVRVLDAHGGTMLAPVLDSLIQLYEAALGRPIVVGEAMLLSGDEHLLLGLIDGSRPRACIDCPEGAASTLDCALCSTRIMLALTLGCPERTLQ